MIDYDYELIMVDDGSQDRSYEVLKKLRERGHHIKVYKLSRNFGLHAAILCGLSHSTGDCAVVKAADIQEPTEMILEMVEKWRQGNNVVLAVRQDREEGKLQKLLASAYYTLIRKTALPNMPRGGFDVFLIDRKVVGVLEALDEKNSAVTGQVLWSGFRTEKIYYTRRAREIGKSRWTLKKKIRLVMDTLFSFSTLPVTVVSVIGVACFMVSFIWGVYVLYWKLVGEIPVSGWTTLFLFNLASFGITMLTLGILGNYLWRSFDASRGRSPYIIEETLDGDKDDEGKESMDYIMPNRLDRGFYRYQQEFEHKAIEVLRSGYYVLGKEVQNFEQEFADYLGAEYCVGVASGLDALWIAFRILGIGAGDEVIVQGNTYIASVMGITINGATPVFVEPDEYYHIDASKIEEKITSRTRAILVVHLYGQASDMGKVMEVAKRHNLRVVEDCAQSHGACFGGRMTGTFGDIGCFSFYPSKNLGAFGDGGAIVTNDGKIAQEVRIFRNYGSEKRYYNKVVGANSRLDEMQAGLLRVRLAHLKELEEEKKQICDRYLREINNQKILLPRLRKNASHIWHQFVVRTPERDGLMQYMESKGVGTIIHYPIPPHRSEAYGYLHIEEGSLPVTEQLAREVLSLPLYNGMTDEEQEYVIRILNGWK